MNFKIMHETKYVFSDEVFLEPHFLRFRPKQTPFITLHDFSLSISAQTAGVNTLEDAEQNIIDFCWFEALTKSLSIRVESKLSTQPYNPFNFIIHPELFNTLPFTYSDHQSSVLHAYLQKLPLTSPLTNYINASLKDAQYNTIGFVTGLTSKLHKDFTVEYRESGAPLEPERTFMLKKGSCRDLSWMQIHMFRHAGIASRFVSGYFYFEMDKPMYELHAWVEVFIPGIGWLGCDPSHGILTGNTHFPLAASAVAQNTMPVSGGIRGSASSQLTTLLTIEKDD
jgi:transglutaminase-like putative cysteine protease